MSNLKNKVILVTGAGQGLGQAITETLAKEKASLIAVDIKSENVKKLEKQLTQNKLQVASFPLDVSDENQVSSLVKQIVDTYGHLDAVVNNAGTDASKSLLDMSVSEWNRVIGVNLTGAFLISKFSFAVMSRQKTGGHIINITSTAAKRAWANAAAYHASKWGLLALSHATLVEGRNFHIKATAVIAGGMKTPFILDRFPDVDPANLQDPKNVADTVKFILTQPPETVIPEVLVLPFLETSWP